MEKILYFSHLKIKFKIEILSYILIIGLGLITRFSLSLGEEDDDGHEEVHGVFPEDVAADGLTERLLPLVDQLLQSVSEWPLRLVDGLPGGSGPQLGPDEGEEGGEKPVGTDGLQEVRQEVSVGQTDSVLHRNVLRTVLF